MGTSSYLPGFSDDSTSDFLAGINAETSEFEKKAILKHDKKLMESEGENLFWAKWTIANCITTTLKHGSYIDEELMEKAKDYYKYCLLHRSVKKYCGTDYKLFHTQIDLILNFLQGLKSFNLRAGKNKKKVYYEPFFEL